MKQPHFDELIDFIRYEATQNELISLYFLNKQMNSLSCLLSPVQRYDGYNTQEVSLTILVHPNLPDEIFYDAISDPKERIHINYVKILELSEEKADALFKNSQINTRIKSQLIQEGRVSKQLLTKLIKGASFELQEYVFESPHVTVEEKMAMIKSYDKEAWVYPRLFIKFLDSKTCPFEVIVETAFNSLYYEDSSSQDKRLDTPVLEARDVCLNEKRTDFNKYLQKNYNLSFSDYSVEWLMKFLNWS